MSNLPPESFTKKFNKGQNLLLSSIGISLPFDEESVGRKPIFHWTSGLWDTGASHCLITKSLAKNFGLTPIDRIKVEHAKGWSYENIYLAFLKVTDKYYLEVELTECQSISKDFEIIIGMDIILQGDFALTNENGITTFSFRLPSQTTIDFTQDSL